MVVITLKDLLDNPPRELEVDGVGTVKVRDPTTEDRIEAMDEARNDPRWEKLKDYERNMLTLEYLSLKMLVEPKVTVEDYRKANSTVLSKVLSAVLEHYAERMGTLQDSKSKAVRDFLGQQKEQSPESSTSS